MATHFFHFEKRLVKFGAGNHVHDGIVNAVENVRVPDVGPRLENHKTIAFRPDAPVGHQNAVDSPIIM
jgi:hypothetical protein